jgi:hypothetical protein
LQGLSADELQYIAEFLGARILESDCQPDGSRSQLAEDVARFERSRRAAAGRRNGCHRSSGSVQDGDHKMILLLEYLSRCVCRQSPLARAAGS